MARFSAGWRTAGAGTTTLPMASLYAAAGVRPRVREIGVFNTTSTAVPIAIRRSTVIGGTHAGAASAIQKVDDTAQTALATVIDTETGTAPTLTSGNVRVATLGAAVGSGVIFTWSEKGLVIPNTTGDGVVIVVLTGTSQICDIYFEWEE